MRFILIQFYQQRKLFFQWKWNSKTIFLLPKEIQFPTDSKRGKFRLGKCLFLFLEMIVVCFIAPSAACGRSAHP